MKDINKEIIEQFDNMVKHQNFSDAELKELQKYLDQAIDVNQRMHDKIKKLGQNTQIMEGITEYIAKHGAPDG